KRHGHVTGVQTCALPISVSPSCFNSISAVKLSLGTILRFMDRESDNFTAEMLLKQLGLTELGRGTSAAGAAVVMQVLADAGVPMTGVRIVDGSGLSQLDRLTANALGSLLKIAW